MKKNSGIFAAAALAIVAFVFAPASSMAQSYSGSWPITWNITSGFTGVHTYCLTLTDNGTSGFPHSGPATVTGNYIVTDTTGFFQVIGNQIVVSFYVAGGYGTIGNVFFVSPASKGTIGNGLGEYAADGAYTDTGAATFGKVGGCGKNDDDAKNNESKNDEGKNNDAPKKQQPKPRAPDTNGE